MFACAPRILLAFTEAPLKHSRKDAPPLSGEAHLSIHACDGTYAKLSLWSMAGTFLCTVQPGWDQNHNEAECLRRLSSLTFISKIHARSHLR